MRAFFQRFPTFFWTFTTRPGGPLTRSDSRLPLANGARRAIFHPRTRVLLRFFFPLAFLDAGAAVATLAPGVANEAAALAPTGRALAELNLVSDGSAENTRLAATSTARACRMPSFTMNHASDARSRNLNYDKPSGATLAQANSPRWRTPPG